MEQSKFTNNMLKFCVFFKNSLKLVLEEIFHKNRLHSVNSTKLIKLISHSAKVHRLTENVLRELNNYILLNAATSTDWI